VKPGDFVIASFVISDGTCDICRAGYPSRCVHTEFVHGTIGTQSERARIPCADGALVATLGRPSDDLVPSLMAASDVLGTGWFAAAAVEVGPGKTAAVVGDGVARVKELTDGLGAHSVIGPWAPKRR
jgi:threonine dehydrogenase-like Zn-dependent dehydrogenase